MNFSWYMNTKMESAIAKSARATNILGMNVFTVMGPDTKYTNAKVVEAFQSKKKPSTSTKSFHNFFNCLNSFFEPFRPFSFSIYGRYCLGK